ncbi:protein YgfX [Candidatus Albibeggiatoa sp. nov. NOAA]|uniref:protein YgfX n=1 Tax=Candidatus Albibeggiatoa sp. nov. NOAA TaxID=3162724 RepID=UPI0032F53BED|nr:hypothetical protein [Thiotrichaceae bacterium]
MRQSIDSILAQELSIYPRFSWRFASLILGLHAGALSILTAVSYFHHDWFIPILGIGLLVLFSAWRTYRRDLCFIQHPLSGSCLAILQEVGTSEPPKEYLLLQNGQRAILLPSCYAHPLLIIINAKILDSNQSVSLILWNDMLDKNTFRRLRVRIKHRFNKLNVQTEP